MKKNYKQQIQAYIYHSEKLNILNFKVKDIQLEEEDGTIPKNFQDFWKEQHLNEQSLYEMSIIPFKKFYYNFKSTFISKL